MLKNIIGFGHVAISVPNLEKAKWYYGEVLKFKSLVDFEFDNKDTNIPNKILRLKGRIKGKALYFIVGNTFLEVFEFDKPKQEKPKEERKVNKYGFTHISFTVDNVEEVYNHLKKHIPKEDFHCEPTWASDSSKMIYTRDPFGNVIEFEELPEDYVLNIKNLLNVFGKK